MKKVILLFLITAVMFSCKKNETTKPDVKKEAEVSFNVTTILPDAGRDWTPSYDVPECDPQAGVATYAKIKIDGLEGGFPGPDGTGSAYFDVPVFWTNNNLYTQALKLPVDPADCLDDVCCTEYTITEFYLYDENDVLIKAAPLPTSPFQDFVDPEHALNLTFFVCAFEKVEIYIDVLCFIPDDYDLFGFFWFEITEITVRELCFFGDVCIDWWLYAMQFPLDGWENSLYAGQFNGIQNDMPAIFILSLYKQDATGAYVHVRDWNNEYYPPDFVNPWLGENDPLCIRYADYDNETDNFKLEMYIYGPWCNPAFCYTNTGETPMPQMVWTWTDGDVSGIDLNDDGVVEFAWGDCVQYPEWPLPLQP